MNSRLVSLAVLAFSTALSVRCGLVSTTEPAPGPMKTARTVYVNVNNTGTADGTVLHPYREISTALNSGVAFDTIIIEAGTYDSRETFPLSLKPGNVLIGAGYSNTLIMGRIVDLQASDSAITLADLTAAGFTCTRAVTFAPLTTINRFRFCNFSGTVEIAHGGNHNFSFDTCQFQMPVRFSHGAGSSVNRLIMSTFMDTLTFATGNGETDTVAYCSIHAGGIFYLSGNTNSLMAYNSLIDGKIYDASGSGSQVFCYNNITKNTYGPEPDSSAVILKGSSVTFSNNTIITTNGNGIHALSGNPTIIDSNYIVPKGGCGILTASGQGEIVGNHVDRGHMGINNRSGASRLAYNIVQYCDTGIYNTGAATIRGNLIDSCIIWGLIVSNSTGSIDSNQISRCGNGATIMAGQADFGGGLTGSAGQNHFTENKFYSLCNWTQFAIMAQHNLWDHANATDIAQFDIYDHTDNGAYGAITFEPFL